MIPKRYEKAKYEDITPDIKASFEKITETRKGLYLHGGVGTGKTHFAYAMKQHWDEKSKSPAMFWNTTELLREIRLDFDRKWPDKLRIEEKLMDYRGLLILDDVGAERMTEWVSETFYLIVNKRYNEMLPIIFTSNLPPGDIAERIGDRITSRIIEMCDIFELVGSDRRINK